MKLDEMRAERWRLEDELRRKMKKLEPEPGLWRHGVFELYFQAEGRYFDVEVFITHGDMRGTPMTLVTANIYASDDVDITVEIHKRLAQQRALRTLLEKWCCSDRGIYVGPAAEVWA